MRRTLFSLAILFCLALRVGAAPNEVTDFSIDQKGAGAELQLLPFTAGHVRVTPKIFARRGRAQVTADGLLFREPTRLFEVSTDYQTFGAGLLVRSNPWMLETRVSKTKVSDARSTAGGFVAQLHDLHATDGSVAIGYSLFSGRVTPSIGDRVTHWQGRIDIPPTTITIPSFDIDRTEHQIVAGVDVRLNDLLSAHIETVHGDHDQQTTASLGIHLGEPPKTDVKGKRTAPSRQSPQSTQSQPEQDCPNAIPVCQNTYVQSNSYSGAGSVQELSNTCLLTNETNSVWYTFTAQTSGTLTFTIQTPNDYDFALYNVTSNGCATIANTPPIRCNNSGTAGLTGLNLPAAPETPPIAYSASMGPMMPGVNVTAGQTYALVVNNYTGNTNGYTLTFGGSASIFDNTPPSIASATIDPASCQIEITTSEPVLCSSIAANGSDFSLLASGATITGATGVGCGTTTKKIRLSYNLNGAQACGTWQLTPKVGSDGNTLIDNCHNALVPGVPISLTTAHPATPNLQINSEFCEKQPIIADGTASTNETSYFWSVVESDANWNVIGPECTQWFQGQASTLDVVQFATQHGCHIKCDHYYRVKLAVVNCCTSWNETVKLIHINCAPKADAGPDKTVCCCGPQKIKIGSPAVPGLQYQWSPTIGLDDPTSSDPTIDMSAFSDPSVTFPGTYTVTVTNAAGCSATDSVYIKTVCGCRPGPTITVTPPPMCSRTYTLTAKCACGDTTPSFLWSNGATTQSIEVLAGTGPYTVTCRNECGSTVSAPVSVPDVTILSGPFPPLQFPNVFTPNGDGINDLWTVTDLSGATTPAYNATEYELLVYNRWGNLVADLTGSTSTGFTNNTIPGFNGVANQSVIYSWWQHLWGRHDVHPGDALVDGTYYWIFRLKNCSTPLTDVGHGFFEILR